MKHIQSRLNAKSTTTTLGNVGSASTRIMKKRAQNTYKVATNGNPQGFSLNGTTRFISVGKDSKMSRGPSCCADTSNTVKISVKNNRGQLADRFRWRHADQEANIYNRWAKATPSDSNTEHIAKQNQIIQVCTPYDPTNVKTVSCTDNCNTRIGQRINYPGYFAKPTGTQGDMNIEAQRRRADCLCVEAGCNN
jgi:hypothetical protein